jgi:hypothetical protein
MNDVSNAYVISKNSIDTQISINEEKLYETENELRIVRAVHHARDYEWQKYRLNKKKKEEDLHRREKEVRKETKVISSLHKSLFQQLSNSPTYDSSAILLLKQREILAIIEEKHNNELIFNLKNDLLLVQKELEKEREQNRIKNNEI